jgi:ribulose-5-phosphate 4-epimerase/fuculose-1-phosphate aldolase
VKSHLEKYGARLVSHGLAASTDDAALYGRDDGIVTNRPEIDSRARELFDRLNISFLLVLAPAPPYREILVELCAAGENPIEPQDGETALFLRDIPVVDPHDSEALHRALAGRIGCVLRDGRIVSRGTVSMEQAFVTAGSICFATFVKYFLDFLNFATRNGRYVPFSPARARRALFLLSTVPPMPAAGRLAPMPTGTAREIAAAMDACGKKTVETRLVDSFFGNISWCDGKEICISQTGSSLDELPGQIDRIPLDGSSTAGLSASSETGTHLAIYGETGARAILHGHPRFSVVLSMYCTETGCRHDDACSRTCPVPRSVCDIPIVPGEVGTGKYALTRTVPPAIRGKRGVIVYGHGVFCAGGSFPETFDSLVSIERTCLARYRELVEGGGLDPKLGKRKE